MLCRMMVEQNCWKFWWPLKGHQRMLMYSFGGVIMRRDFLNWPNLHGYFSRFQLHQYPVNGSSPKLVFFMQTHWETGIIFGTCIFSKNLYLWRLSGKMAQDLLIIKANLNKLLLAPSNDPDEEDIEWDDEKE